MATYYIRPDGSDANTGTGPGTASAWQTIRKAVASGSPVVGGDVVYIAPGAYREASALASAIAPTSTTQFIGDINATQFSGVASGLVIWSASATDDTAPVGGNWDFASLTNTTWSNITFDNNINFGSGPTGGGPNNTFTKCLFSSNSSAQPTFIRILARTTAFNWAFDRCLFQRGVYFDITATTSDTDLNIAFTNCLFDSNSNHIWAYVTGTTAGYGGFRIYNCTFIGASNTAVVFEGDVVATWSTTTKNTIRNCVFGPSVTAIFQMVGGNVVDENYNRIVVGSRTNVTAGANDISAGIYGLDMMARLIQGLSKRHPWMPQIAGILDGDGTATGAPATDLFGYTRPGTPSVGALEINDLTAGGGLLVHPGMTGGIRG